MQIEAINEQFIALLCQAHPERAAKVLIALSPPETIDYDCVEEEDDEIPAMRREVAIVVNAVALYYGIDIRDILSFSSLPKIVRARLASMYLAREITALPYMQLFSSFNRQDHVSILRTHRKAERLIERDSDFAREVDEIARNVSTSTVESGDRLHVLPISANT